MRRLRRHLIELSLLTLPLGLVVEMPASAATLSAEQGLTILAKAKASDHKCSFLSRAERAELSSYLARAEMASGNIMSAKAANQAIAKGRAAGKAGKCNEAARNDVEETLSAARLAIAQADGVRPTRPDKTEKPVKSGSTGPADPAEYRDLTKPYFVDLRCKQLGGRKARLYYEAIRDLQKSSAAKFGTAAISGAQDRAKREAREMSCGPASKKLAEQGLAAILRK